MKNKSKKLKEQYFESYVYNFDKFYYGKAV